MCERRESEQNKEIQPTNTQKGRKEKYNFLKRVVRTEQGLQIMGYKIKTDDAKKAVKIIFDCVKKREDPQEKNIQTWDVASTKENEQVLVHTAKTFEGEQQWANKGCLAFTPNKENDVITVKFYYWDTYPEEQCDENDKNYILGRFTELMLVHFPNLFQKIVIS